VRYNVEKNKDDLKLIQMSLTDGTIERVKELDEYTNGSNKTRVVAEAIAIYKLLMDIHKEDGTIYSKHNNENKEKINLPYFPGNDLSNLLDLNMGCLKVVQFKLSEKTIERIEKIDNYFIGNENKAQIVAEAIRMFKLFMDMHKEDKNLYAYYKNNRPREKIVIPYFPGE